MRGGPWGSGQRWYSIVSERMILQPNNDTDFDRGLVGRDCSKVVVPAEYQCHRADRVQKNPHQRNRFISSLCSIPALANERHKRLRRDKE